MTGFGRFLCATALCCGLCGCGDPDDNEQAPPIEGLQLLDRMFGNMEKRNFSVAAVQYQKLMSNRDQIDPIALLMEQIIITNGVVTEAQKKLDAGDLDGALLYARDAKRLNPLNLEIDAMLSDLQYVAALRDAVVGVRSAKTVASLEPALTALNTLLTVDKRSAPLKNVAVDGKARLEKMVVRENKLGLTDLLADVYYAGLTDGRDLSIMRAQCEYEMKKKKDSAAVPAAVRNALYKRP